MPKLIKLCQDEQITTEQEIVCPICDAIMIVYDYEIHKICIKRGGVEVYVIGIECVNHKCKHVIHCMPVNQNRKTKKTERRVPDSMHHCIYRHKLKQVMDKINKERGSADQSCQK